MAIFEPHVFEIPHPSPSTGIAGGLAALGTSTVRHDLGLTVGIFGLASPSGRGALSRAASTYSLRRVAVFVGVRRARAKHHLDQSTPVPHVQKDQPAVITPLVQPTGQCHNLPDVLRP
jgi:hypothetical protein